MKQTFLWNLIFTLSEGWNEGECENIQNKVFGEILLLLLRFFMLNHLPEYVIASFMQMINFKFEDIALVVDGTKGLILVDEHKETAETCKPGWEKDDGNSTNFGISCCCCHMVCTVLKIDEADKDHYLLNCQIIKGFVKSKYW